MGEFINVLVSKGKSNLIPEKDNLYGQFVGEWDFEWVDNQGTTGERHVQGEWIFAWVLEGTAIQDVFICPSRKARIKDYQPDAAYATAVRMYNPNTEAWDILYTELGGATQLEGKREGNRIVQTEINEKNIQWVFSEITTYAFGMCFLEHRRWLADFRYCTEVLEDNRARSNGQDTAGDCPGIGRTGTCSRCAGGVY